jgi:hypothetical protein
VDTILKDIPGWPRNHSSVPLAVSDLVRTQEKGKTRDKSRGSASSATCMQDSARQIHRSRTASTGGLWQERESIGWECSVKSASAESVRAYYCILCILRVEYSPIVTIRAGLVYLYRYAESRDCHVEIRNSDPWLRISKVNPLSRYCIYLSTSC